MLLIARLAGQSIELFDVVTQSKIIVKINDVRGDKVRLAISAPDRVAIYRTDLEPDHIENLKNRTRVACGLSPVVGEVERKDSHEEQG